jgi:import inner membrane translocase subunit TIM8
MASRDDERFAKILQQQASLMDGFSKLSLMCFERCVTRPKASLSTTEDQCLTNCVDRYYDTQLFMLTRLQSKAERDNEKHS